jgi:hypothetical protein
MIFFGAESVGVLQMQSSNSLLHAATDLGVFFSNLGTVICIDYIGGASQVFFSFCLAMNHLDSTIAEKT